MHRKKYDDSRTGGVLMVEPAALCARRDLFISDYPGESESEVEPRAITPIVDVDHCLDAIADLALDVGYFSDLVLAERRLAAIRQWLEREMARYDDL